MYLSSALIPWNHIHPALVHFTTALLPASFASDILGKFTQRYSLTPAAWWMLLYGAIATPMTVVAGWIWAGEIAGPSGVSSIPGLAVHQWLGTALVFCFVALAVWRGRFFMRGRKPGTAYLAVAGGIVAALMYQGYIGGKMTLG